MPPTADEFRERLREWLKRAEDEGKPHEDINAGELHRDVGGYPPGPGQNHHMRACCGVVRGEMRDGDRIIEEPPKGDGASLTVRYELPR